MKLKNILVGGMLLSTLILCGCVEEKEIRTTISLFEGESKTVLELDVTLTNVNSSFWYTDNIATLLVKYIPSNTSTTLILVRTDDVKCKQSFEGYTFKFVGTNDEGAVVINIYREKSK